METTPCPFFPVLSGSSSMPPACKPLVFDKFPLEDSQLVSNWLNTIVLLD